MAWIDGVVNDPTRRAAREKRGSSPGQALPFQGVDRQRRTPAFTAFSRDQTNNSPTIEGLHAAGPQREDRQPFMMDDRRDFHASDAISTL